MMRAMRSVCAVVQCVFVAGAATAATYWVNAENLDPETGETKASIDRHEIGFTPENGFGTLAEASSWTSASGTVFKVCPGIYDAGVYNGRNRLLVRPNTTWIAVEGPEKTVILGRHGSGEGCDEFGNGTGALRCVMIQSGSEIRGFTLTGGATANINDSDIGFGGAVQAKNATGVRIVDCIISNNTAYSCAAAYMGTFINCRFFDNKSPNGPGIGQSLSMINCVTKDSYGIYAVNQSVRLVNCTFGSHTGSPNGAYNPQWGAVNMGNAPVNCIFISTADLATTSGGAASKCASNCLYIADFPHGGTRVNCRKVTLAELDLDEDLKPSRSSAAVAFGSTDDFPAEYLGYATIDRTPRVLDDGKIDAGAYEYDWRADYAAAIGEGVTVTNVSSIVKMGADGKVSIPDGAEISGTLATPEVRTRVGYSAFSSDAGTLYGDFANGDSGRSLDACAVTDSEEARSFAVRRDVPIGFSFRFDGEGYGSVYGLTAVSEILGLQLFIR